MSNGQAQTPTEGFYKTNETREKQEMKTTKMIEAKKIATTGMGKIQERLHCTTHRVKVLKAESEALG